MSQHVIDPWSISKVEVEGKMSMAIFCGQAMIAAVTNKGPLTSTDIANCPGNKTCVHYSETAEDDACETCRRNSIFADNFEATR